MVSDKDRIYVALYARGRAAKMPGCEDRYHWALIIGPKVENKQSRGLRFHAKNTISTSSRQMPWVFEERETSLMATNQLLVRVVIGKIKNRNRLIKILRNVPVIKDEPSWNSVFWVKEALAALEEDGKAVGTLNFHWQSVRDTAMEYCQRKIDEGRFDDQPGSIYTSVPPTFDILEGRESSP